MVWCGVSVCQHIVDQIKTVIIDGDHQQEEPYSFFKVIHETYTGYLVGTNQDRNNTNKARISKLDSAIIDELYNGMMQGSVSLSAYPPTPYGKNKKKTNKPG